MKIVIVDNEPDFVDILANCIWYDFPETENISLFQCSFKALDFLKMSGNQDLLITDISMPGMNGVELSSHAKQIFPDLPIISVTAVPTMIPDENIGLYYEILPKPFKNHEITSVMKSLVNNS